MVEFKTKKLKKEESGEIFNYLIIKSYKNNNSMDIFILFNEIKMEN